MEYVIKLCQRGRSICENNGIKGNGNDHISFQELHWCIILVIFHLGDCWLYEELIICCIDFLSLMSTLAAIAIMVTGRRISVD